LGEKPIAVAGGKEPLLRLSGIGKTFGASVNALSDVSFDIADNEFFTLLGPSGCGKTTLLRIMAGFEHPTVGTLLLDGRDIAHDPPFRRPVNTMFQSYALFPHLNVRQNVSYGLEMLKWSKADIGARVDEVLRLVQMESFAERRPNQMSGGQQQRIALARALAPRPRVLLLDEPLSALDLKLRKAMQVELKRLQRETQLTFVMVTHDQEEALALSDCIAVMSKGLVQQVGTPEEIYARPRNRFVADFIGEANIIPAAALGESGPARVIRPEQITTGPASGDAERGVTVRIVTHTFLGADTLIEARLGDGTTLRVRQRGAVRGLADGAELPVSWARAAEWPVTE
jgi:spermidine/putrescine transport system ATP-binding protein